MDLHQIDLDLVGTRVARSFAETAALDLLNVPVAMPSRNLSMLWSRQRAGELVLEWLRSVLVTICAVV